MEHPTDPRKQAGLFDEFVSAGLTALVAERIVDGNGERMETTSEDQPPESLRSNSAPETEQHRTAVERHPVRDDLGMQRLGAIR